MRTILIISLCSLLALPVLAKTRSGSAVADVKMLSQACKAFQIVYGVYPPEKTWMSELRPDINAVINTNGLHFIEGGTKAIDPWDNPFVYKYPGKHNPDSFDLFSLGCDGITKTDGNDPDDISNWHAYGWAQRYYNPTPIPPLWLVFFVVTCVVLIIRLLMNSESGNKIERSKDLKVSLACLSALLTFSFSFFIYVYLTILLEERILKIDDTSRAIAITILVTLVGLSILNSIFVAKRQHRLLAYCKLRTNYIVLAILIIITLLSLLAVFIVDVPYR